MEILRLALVFSLAFAAILFAIRFFLSGHVLRSVWLQIGLGGALGSLGAIVILASQIDLLSEEVEAILAPVVLILGSALVLTWAVVRLVAHVRRD